MSTSFECSFLSAEDHPCYVHHFPDNPLVPGALLISWLIEHIEQTITGVSIEKVKTAKFISVLRPNEMIQLIFHYIPDNHTIKFSASGPQGLLCKGVMISDG